MSLLRPVLPRSVSPCALLRAGVLLALLAVVGELASEANVAAARTKRARDLAFAAELADARNFERGASGAAQRLEDQALLEARWRMRGGLAPAPPPPAPNVGLLESVALATDIEAVRPRPPPPSPPPPTPPPGPPSVLQQVLQGDSGDGSIDPQTFAAVVGRMTNVCAPQSSSGASRPPTKERWC